MVNGVESCRGAMPSPLVDELRETGGPDRAIPLG